MFEKLYRFKFNRGLTSFINPYSMLVLKDHPDLAEGIDFWYADGISLVNSINKKLDKNIERYSFDDTSLAPVIFGFAKKNGLKVAIVGTKEEFIHDAVSNIISKYKVFVPYYRNGYFFDEKDRNVCFDKIKISEIDIVVCGMGTPYQEKFLIDLKNSGWDGYGFTCGGYLHQMAKKEDYYPEFFDKYNIRWVYRIMDEPKLFRRYFVDYPKFFFKFSLFKSNKPIK